MRSLSRAGVPVLFRGDSHLLDRRGSWWRWQLKKTLLTAIYRWPAAFLCVGQANKNYYRAFGVPEDKLFDCPHSIETERFAEPHAVREQEAAAGQLGIGEDQQVVLFAGKFEDKKRPVSLMRAFLQMDLPNVILLLVGDGVLGEQFRDLAAKHPDAFASYRFRIRARCRSSIGWGTCSSCRRLTARPGDWQ